MNFQLILILGAIPMVVVALLLHSYLFGMKLTQDNEGVICIRKRCKDDNICQRHYVDVTKHEAVRQFRKTFKIINRL